MPSQWRSVQVCSPCSDPNLPPLDRHLAQNPFICDCNLKWLADFLRTNPIETSGARCASPRRLANKRIGQVKSKKFRCSGSRLPRCLPPACSGTLCCFLDGHAGPVLEGAGPTFSAWM